VISGIDHHHSTPGPRRVFLFSPRCPFLITMSDHEFFQRVLTLSSEEESFRCARRLGEIAEPGLVVALSGNLGAGKTRFVQAAAEGLGISRNEVNSPTFVLIHEYAGRMPVYHFDTYRLRDLDEFLELGADEYLHGDGVCFVEWAERMAEALPRDRLNVVIEITGPNERRWIVTAGGACSLRAISRWLADS